MTSLQPVIILHMKTTDALSMLTVRVPSDLIGRAKIRAVKEKTTLQKMVTALLEAHLRTPLKRQQEERS